MLKEIRQNCGRTMLEMLSVLAIIGILTAVGLSMYKNAIYSHKANIILNDTRMIAATVLQKETIKPDAEGIISTAEYKPETSYDIYALEVKEETTFAVAVEGVEENVCKAILDKAGDNYSLEVQGATFDGNNTKICQAENTVKFMFDLTGLCDSKNPAYCYGICCAEGEVCHEESRGCGPVCEEDQKPFGTNTVGVSICCPSDTESVCGKNCCTGEMSCCAGECCPSGECSDFETGECCGTDKNGVQLKGDREAKKCICPGGMTLMDGACGCPEGRPFVNGICMELECYEAKSTTVKCTSSKCDCYIGGQRCGTGCKQNGLSCSYGMCSNECITGTNYDYNSGTMVFGCSSEHYFGPGETNLKGVHCTHNGGGLYCFVNGSADICSRGTLTGLVAACDVSYCPEGTFIEKMPKRHLTDYACWDGKHFCIELWCYSYTEGDDDVKICAGGCQNNDYKKCSKPNHCEGECAESFSYDNERNVCCNADGVCCYHSQGSSYACNASSGKVCGYGCNSGVCSVGTCNPSDCPDETEWVLTGYSGQCYDATRKILCQKHGTTYDCSKNVKQMYGGYYGEPCGYGCQDGHATGCPKCFDDSETCPGGELVNYSSCKYGDLTCSPLLKEGAYTSCSKNGYFCGNCKNPNGTDCYERASTQAAKSYCSVADCGAGETLLYDNTKSSFPYYCGKIGDPICELSGDTYTCRFGANPCGTECNSDGSNCSSGICVASECPDGTHLEQTTYKYYGCYNATTGTSCYRLGEDEDDNSNPLYVCYKNSTECGTECDDATGKSCKKGAKGEGEQTCFVEEVEE